MKTFLFTRLLAVLVLMLPYATVLAQEASMQSVIAGLVYPLSLAPSDLTDEYHAVRVPSAGSTDSWTMYGPMLSMSLGAENPEMAKLVKYSELLWTKGDVTTVEGQRFLVGYRLDISLAEIAAQGRQGFGTLKSSDFAAKKLRLSLVKVEGISTLEPEPAITPADLRAVFAARATPVAQSDSAAKAQTMSNMKQVALSLIMYSADYDDVLPYAQSTRAAQYVTYPYVKSAELWKTKNPNGGQFLFNVAIGGVEQNRIDTPAETVLTYESKEWPDGSRVVAFVDGHVRSVSRAQWKELTRWLKRKYKAKGKPLPAKYGQNWVPGAPWKP